MQAIEMVVAIAENGVIGRDGGLPWRLSGDLRHFKRLTSGHSLLMGRRTWDSLPGLLPERRHIVLSRDAGFAAQGVQHARSIDHAVDLFARDAREGERLFAIGGAGIYEQVWERSSDLHLTRVHAEVAGDTYFPALDLRDWQKAESTRHRADARNDHPFTLEHWRRDDRPMDTGEVLTCGEVGWLPIRQLLSEFALEVRVSPPGRPIPATFWGEPEAGIRGSVVYARQDTPIHSLLHEAGHAILAGDQRRSHLDVDAGGDQLEEDAVCVLQLLLAEHLPGAGTARVAADMDAWGYRFASGSTARFFTHDSRAARDLLQQRLGLRTVGREAPSDAKPT